MIRRTAFCAALLVALAACQRGGDDTPADVAPTGAAQTAPGADDVRAGLA